MRVRKMLPRLGQGRHLMDHVAERRRFDEQYALHRVVMYYIESLSALPDADIRRPWSCHGGCRR
jgi:hypothetical protein